MDVVCGGRDDDVGPGRLVSERKSSDVWGDGDGASSGRGNDDGDEADDRD